MCTVCVCIRFQIVVTLNMNFLMNFGFSSSISIILTLNLSFYFLKSQRNGFFLLVIHKGEEKKKDKSHKYVSLCP